VEIGLETNTISKVILGLLGHLGHLDVNLFTTNIDRQTSSGLDISVTQGPEAVKVRKVF